MKKNNIFISGKKNYNYLDSGLGEFVYLVVQYLLIAVFQIALILGLPRGGWVNELASFVVEVGFVATVFIVSSSTKTAVLPATKLDRKPKGSHIGFTILIAVIAYFGFSSLTNSFVDLLDIIGYKSSSSGINVDVWWKYILYTITMAAVPAFCEELLFRGVIYQGLRKWSKTGAIFVSAALFMLMHGSPDQTVHQFLLGIVLAMVFNATGSIWCPMLLHFLNNFIALTLSFIVSSIKQKSGIDFEAATSEVQEVAKVSATEFFTSLVGAIASSVIAGVLIWLIIGAMKKKTKTAKDAALQTTENSQGTGGEVVEKNTEAEDADAENQDGTVVSEKGKKFTIVFFVLSGIWVAYEWISALIVGLLR